MLRRVLAFIIFQDGRVNLFIWGVRETSMPGSKEGSCGNRCRNPDLTSSVTTPQKHIALENIRQQVKAVDAARERELADEIAKFKSKE